MDKQTKSGMPVDESKYSFTIPRTDEPREKILKLGAMITDRIGKVTGNDPEYWGLAGVVTDEMADVALKMKVRKPKTTAQIAALTGKSEEELEKLLTEMAYIGLVEYNWENLDGKNPNHEKRWTLPQFVPGSAEFVNMRQSQIDEHPEPYVPRQARRGLRRRSAGLVHRRGRYGALRRRDRPRPLHHL